LSLFDKKNNTLKYKQFQNNNEQILVTEEDSIFSELDDWIIENMFRKNNLEN